MGDSFKRLKNQLYKDQPEGFYVRAKPNLCSNTSEDLSLPLPELIPMTGILWLSIISAMRSIKRSQNASPPLTLLNAWLFISLTGTLKWSVTTVFMQSTTNRKKISGNVYPLKSSNIFPDSLIGVIQFWWLLAMIRLDARSVALLCWF